MMFGRFTERAQKVLMYAQEEAKNLQHGYVGTEHILLGILREDSMSQNLLNNMNVTLNDVKELIEEYEGKGDIDIYRNIKTFTLHYQDRVFFNDYISDLSKIEEIVKLKTPVIKVLDNSSVSPNNIFSKFTVPINEINGYSIITVNTGTSMPANQQILIVECRIKGKFDGGKIDEWFNKAHDLQVKFFEDFFNKKILESWKQ